MGSSLNSGLAGGALGISGGSIGGNVGGNSQSMLSQGTSGQYSFQGHDASRLLQGAPFLTPVSFQGTIMQPQSGSFQYGLNQTNAMAPSSPAPGAQSQQTHQSYPQAAAAAAAGFLPTQAHQAAAQPPSGLHTNFGPILSVSLSQNVPSHSYLNLTSPSYTRASHDLGLTPGHTSSVIMKPQTTMGGLTKTVSSVAFGSVSTVPAGQQSHIFNQQRAASQLGAQQAAGMMTTNALIAAMTPNPAPATAPAHHPTHGQHTSFFSGGPQVAAAAANSQVGSTNFFNTLQGSRSNLQASVQAIQPLPIQLPQSTLPSQYSLAAAQQTHQSSQPIVHPIGAAVGGFANAYGDIGTQPKHPSRTIPSGFGLERQQSTPSMLDIPMDLIARSDTSVSRSSNLSQHVDAKPFSPNRQMSSSGTTANMSHKQQEEKYGLYVNKGSIYKAPDQSSTSKPLGYSAAPVSIGHYGVDERKTYSQPRVSSTDPPRFVTADTVSKPKLISEASVPNSLPSSLPASLSFSMTAVTMTTTTASSGSQIYSQSSKVSHSPSLMLTATSALHQPTPATKATTASSPPSALPQSMHPPRGFTSRTVSSNPRMPPQMFGPSNPHMMTMMGMRYPPPFPQGPPPPRGAQFMPPGPPPPRMPQSTSGANASVPSGPSPPNPQPLKSQPPKSQASKSQSPSSASQSGPTQSKSSQGGYQSNKGKPLQGLPGPSKLQKAPSHFSRRPAVDRKMTPEELMAEKNKERAKLLASTKAFFSKKGQDGESKEKSDKSDN